MKKKLMVAVVGGALSIAMVGGVASANNGNAHGKTIKDATGGTSFGQLIGPSKAAGTSTHDNYKGGAKAFAGLLEAHGIGGE